MCAPRTDLAALPNATYNTTTGSAGRFHHCVCIVLLSVALQGVFVAAVTLTMQLEALPTQTANMPFS
jgi:hypothetical protein